MKELGSRAAAWQASRLGLILLLFAVSQAWGQAGGPALNRPVQLTPGRRSLGAVLAELSRQSRLPFSYSSSLVPLAHTCYPRPGPPRPVAVVLREVLAAEHLSYGLLDGQLVLWPDHLAAPVGIAAATGRAAVLARATPSRYATPAPITAIFDEVGRLAGAPGSRLAGRTTPPPKPQAVRVSEELNGEPTNQTRAANAVPKAGSKRLLPSVAAAKPGRAAAPSPANRAAPQGEAAPHDGRAGFSAKAGPSVAGRLTGGASRVAARLHPGSQATVILVAAPKLATARRPYPAAHSARSARPAAPARGPLDLLAPRPVLPEPTAKPAGALLPGRQLAQVSLAAAPPSPSNLSQRADSSPDKSSSLGVFRQPFYLHGEAWASETLPLSAAVKVGWPRIYLVLGVAAGPFDRRGGWAWGGGLGTTGRPRGRFTPSLDLLHWVVAGVGRDEGPPSQLTQLRPALGWQLKRGGHWQLVGGPTLNLATARRDGSGNSPTLGQGQWRWLDADGERSSVRIWPGVLLGLRF